MTDPKTDPARDAAMAELLRDAGHVDVAEALEAKVSKPPPTEAELFVDELKSRNDAAWSEPARGLLED
jgi:hypothetical protein